MYHSDFEVSYLDQHSPSTTKVRLFDFFRFIEAYSTMGGRLVRTQASRHVLLLASSLLSRCFETMKCDRI